MVFSQEGKQERMAQIAKMESQVDIKSSAEKFFQTFCNKQNELPKMCPNVVKDLQLIKGDWQSVGSIRKWIFVPGGDENNFILTTHYLFSVYYYFHY